MIEKEKQLTMTNNHSALVFEETPESVTMLLGGGAEKSEQLAAHRLQMASICKQYPHPYQIGVYIRYYNQTKHENYLENHIAHFREAISLCPKLTLVDFYIYEGQTATYMENAPQWSRLVEDCFSGKVDLVITQMISNVVRKDNEKQLTFLASILAAQEHPVGMYFIAENIFTLATYYTEDLYALELFPEG